MHKYNPKNLTGTGKRKILLFLLFLTGITFIFPACAANNKNQTPGNTAIDEPEIQQLELGFYQQGIASWYGRQFHGKATASGEIYDMHDLTAAHKKLPLGTRVLVTNLENQRQVEVVINDRGPFVKNRIIDLSKRGAKKLGMFVNGTALVRLDIIELPKSISISKDHPFAIQFGAYRDRETALKIQKKIALKNGAVFIDKIYRSDGALYRVRLGWFSSRRAAHREARRLGFRKALIFRR